jgi:hypothetical protein
MVVAGVAALAVVAFFAVYGASRYLDQSSQPPHVTSSVDDRSADAATRAANAELTAYAAGDWRGAWDLWTAAGKQAISRTDYQRYHTECQTITGIPFQIKTLRLEGDSEAVLVVERQGVQFSYSFFYEDHAWRFQPDTDAMASYAKGVDKLIAECKTS